MGAGVDSYYEILLKSFIMFGEAQVNPIAAAVQNLNILTISILFQDAEMFHVSYDKIKQYMRRGR